MEAITRRYPNTHLDKMARIRLKRIPRTAEEWLEEKRNKPLHLPALHDDLEEAEEMETGDLETVRQRAELFSQKLAREPNDTAARENFARALAKLNKLQAAIDQMGLLLEMEGQLITHRAEWMGLKAAWMMKLTPANPEVRSLLRQIVQDFPHSPQAVAAQRRIFLMDEQARVAKYAGQKKRKRISIHVDEGQKQGQNSGTLTT